MDVFQWKFWVNLPLPNFFKKGSLKAQITDKKLPLSCFLWCISSTHWIFEYSLSKKVGVKLWKSLRNSLKKLWLFVYIYQGLSCNSVSQQSFLDKKDNQTSNELDNFIPLGHIILWFATRQKYGKHRLSLNGRLECQWLDIGSPRKTGTRPYVAISIPPVFDCYLLSLTRMYSISHVYQ